MPTPIHPITPRTTPAEPARPNEPRILWDRVLTARALVASQRHLPADRSVSAARAELLAALEAYVACLASCGRPIPYPLRDELRLQRLTCPGDRELRYDPFAGRRAPRR